ncbi:hypothetical protein OESDEN_02017 [Oesophagostomum dentatum]|uniref:Transthyretin-like family protein n=1 Tax=Oesophagostomum dentatum TaxID=61180 RepID=A0A0B1TPE4_OESDE|nr:hypothetical protein OESDEN_02017 [Oesophagostomum dentatum]
MSAVLRLLALLFCIITITDSFPCKIIVRVTSKTEKKFKALVIVPSIGIRSEPMIFQGKSTKKIKVHGEDCAKKPWIIRTYKWKDDEWKPAKNMTAKLQGNGWMRVVVGDNLMPVAGERFGVICSEGLCG